MRLLGKIALLGFIIFSIDANTQVTAKNDLFNTLKTKDSILFDAAFNNCGIQVLKEMFTEDFEFYHDKVGITEGRDAFVRNIENGCKNLSDNDLQPAKRILIPNSLEVYPMYAQGVLYGAIQHGVHTFEFLNENGRYEKGDIAKFTHVWVLDRGNWKIKRELSYNHEEQLN
ncbi:MAG: nuclear transport factor 2 family protein [Croceivirga sp.]